MEGRATGPSGRWPQSWGTVLLLYDGFSWRPWAPLDRSHVPALCCGVTGEPRAPQDEDPAGTGCRTCRHHPRDLPSPGGSLPCRSFWGPRTGVLGSQHGCLGSAGLGVLFLTVTTNASLSPCKKIPNLSITVRAPTPGSPGI